MTKRVLEAAIDSEMALGRRRRRVTAAELHADRLPTLRRYCRARDPANADSTARR